MCVVCFDAPKEYVTWSLGAAKHTTDIHAVWAPVHVRSYPGNEEGVLHMHSGSATNDEPQ